MAFGLLLLGVLPLLSGCYVPAVLAYKLGLEPPIPAKYVPPRVPLLVLAENYRSPASHAIEADQLARFVSEELERRKIAPIVGQSKLEALRRERPDEFRGMKVEEVGAAVGAQQVLYMDIVHWSMSELDGSDMARGSATVYVRIVDVASGATVWPSDSAGGHPVSYESPYRSSGEGVTMTDIRMRVLRALADRTAKLFYPWKPEGVGGNQ